MQEKKNQERNGSFQLFPLLIPTSILLCTTNPAGGPFSTHLGCTCNIHSLHNVSLAYLCCVLPILPFQKPRSEC